MSDSIQPILGQQSGSALSREQVQGVLTSILALVASVGSVRLLGFRFAACIFEVRLHAVEEEKRSGAPESQHEGSASVVMTSCNAAPKLDGETPPNGNDLVMPIAPTEPNAQRLRGVLGLWHPRQSGREGNGLVFPNSRGRGFKVWWRELSLAQRRELRVVEQRWDGEPGKIPCQIPVFFTLGETNWGPEARRVESADEPRKDGDAVLAEGNFGAGRLDS